MVAAACAVDEPARETSALEYVTGSITHPSGIGSRKLKVYSNGVLNIGRTIFSLTAAMNRRTVIARWDAQGDNFANTQDEIIADHSGLQGTTFVVITTSRVLFGQEQKSGQLSPKARYINCYRSP